MPAPSSSCTVHQGISRSPSLALELAGAPLHQVCEFLFIIMRRALSPAHWRQSLRAWPRAARCAGSAHVQPATVYGGQQRTFTTAVPASYYETTTLSAEDLRFARRVAATTKVALYI